MCLKVIGGRNLLCRQKQERRIYTKCNFTGGEENVFQRRLKTTQY
jgi:hypothetical protein